MGGLGFWKTLISCTAGLALLVMSYSLFGPFMDYLVFFTTDLGAPANNALFLLTMFRWAFGIMGVSLILIPLLVAYMDTYDTGKYENQYYYIKRRIKR